LYHYISCDLKDSTSREHCYPQSSDRINVRPLRGHPWHSCRNASPARRIAPNVSFLRPSIAPTRVGSLAARARARAGVQKHVFLARPNAARPVTKRARARRIRNIERAEALCSRSVGSEKTRSLDLSFSRACARALSSFLHLLSPSSADPRRDLRRGVSPRRPSLCRSRIRAILRRQNRSDSLLVSERTERARGLGERSAKAREEKKRCGGSTLSVLRAPPRRPFLKANLCARFRARFRAAEIRARQWTLDNPGALLGSPLARD